MNIVTDRVINNLKPKERPYKKSVGDGLFIVVRPSGYKGWRYEYTLQGVPKTLTIGPYPVIGLAEARDKLRTAKATLLDGTDPSTNKRQQASKTRGIQEHTFENLGKEWFRKKKIQFSKGHAKNTEGRMRRIIYPALGSMPIDQIKPQHLMAVLNPIEEKGHLELAHRVMQICGNVFRYAIKIGIIERDITADMRGVLLPRQERHHPTITEPTKVGEMMRAIDGYNGYVIVQYALKLAPLTFVRPGELRGAKWEEFILSNAEWRIPAERMKMKEEHIIPLSRQAVELVTALKKYSGDGVYLFPSIRTKTRTISENTVNGVGISKKNLPATDSAQWRLPY